MVTLSIALMHQRCFADRRAWVISMHRQMAQDLDMLEGFKIITQPEGKGPWPVARAAWMYGLSTGATHHCVIQDDALLARDFIPGLLKIAAVKPDEIITGFSMRQMLHDARKKGVHWVTTPDAAMGICMLMPRALVSDFLKWERKHIKADYKHDDGRLTGYAYMHHKRIWTTSPSLLEHIGALESTIGNPTYFGPNRQTRVSSYFTGKSLLDIDWTKGSRNPITAPGTVSRKMMEKRFRRKNGS